MNAPLKLVKTTSVEELVDRLTKIISDIYGKLDNANRVINLIEGELYDGIVTWTSISGRPSSSVADIDDAVNKKHTQNTDQYLDYGGGNQISASTLKSHVEDTTNPHSVTKDQVGLGNVKNEEQVSNAGTTPSIQAGLDADKPAAGTVGRIYIATDTFKIYRDNGTDWELLSTKDHVELTNIGTNTHTDIDNHIANTTNPHNVTAAQTGAPVSIDGVSNAGGDIDFIAGSTRISISPDDVDKNITFDVVETNINHDNLAGYVASEHVSLPNTIVNVLTDHDLTNHESLGLRKITFDTSANKPTSGTSTELFIETDTNIIYRGTGTGWQEVGRYVGMDFPNTIANVLTDHDKATHDALGIDADTLDTKHYSDISAEIDSDVSAHNDLADPHALATSVGGKTLPSGDIVGTTDTQTIENKTLQNCEIKAVADIGFLNKWRITEKSNGQVIDALLIIDEKREEIVRFSREGIFFKGQKIGG